ncbi:UNVERIFIED_CONTAM: hypothetical protein FKN15_065491 [Acipenser sinensis]
MGGRRGKVGGRRGKEKEKQQPQQQLNKRWWSWVPSKFGPPDWAAEQELWRKEGAPMCGACGEFGHVREDCPYGDPQYEEAWNQGLVGDAAEWFWAVDQTRPSPAHQREEPELRRGGAPAAFAGRRGGAPAAFAARRGGSPAAFAASTTFITTATTFATITTAFTTPTNTLAA